MVLYCIDDSSRCGCFPPEQENRMLIGRWLDWWPKSGSLFPLILPVYWLCVVSEIGSTSAGRRLDPSPRAIR